MITVDPEKPCPEVALSPLGLGNAVYPSDYVLVLINLVYPSDYVLIDVSSQCQCNWLQMMNIFIKLFSNSVVLIKLPMEKASPHIHVLITCCIGVWCDNETLRVFNKRNGKSVTCCDGAEMAFVRSFVSSITCQLVAGSLTNSRRCDSMRCGAKGLAGGK